MMIGLKQKRYMLLTSLEQTKAMMTANLIDSDEITSEIIRKDVA